MEKDLDIKLYNEYLDGNKEAFELLYNKYKKKYNILFTILSKTIKKQKI